MDAVAANQAAVIRPEQPISSETVGEIIRQIEAKYDLLQFQVDGWCVWPLLRFPAALELMKLPFAVTKESFSLSELSRMAAKDLPKILLPRSARYVVLTLSSELMEEDGGRFRDVFFDELLQEIGSFFKIETLNNKAFLTRSNSALLKRDVTSSTLDLLATLVLPKFGRNNQINKVAESLHAELQNEPGLEGFSSQRIAARLEDFYWRKRSFAWLLRRVKPQYLFTADGYSDHAPIAAAKELGIKVFEFQHGGFMKGGPEYGWSDYAAKYKSRMPISDYFFLFGGYWKDQLDSDDFWGESLQPVGSLRMDDYRKRLRPPTAANDGTRRLLLTTQGIDTERLIHFVSEFLKLAAEIEIELAIKLHPAYESDKEIYERSFGPNTRVRIISGSEEPSTFELLALTDLHLSISSTCHFEALGLGVPTVILPLANSQWIMSLHRCGHALLAQSPRDLVEIVRNLENHKVPESLSAYYFKPGALDNMKHALSL